MAIGHQTVGEAHASARRGAAAARRTLTGRPTGPARPARHPGAWWRRRPWMRWCGQAAGRRTRPPGAAGTPPMRRGRLRGAARPRDRRPHDAPACPGAGSGRPSVRPAPACRAARGPTTTAGPSPRWSPGRTRATRAAAGMEPDPWMAMPPTKYFGRYRVPRGASRRPSISRLIVKRPVGVVATAVPPAGDAYASPLPVEVLSTHLVCAVPPRRGGSDGARSISRWVPEGSTGAGRAAPARAASVVGPATPSRPRPSAFWKAITAWRVSCPYRPSDAPCQ